MVGTRPQRRGAWTERRDTRLEIRDTRLEIRDTRLEIRDTRRSASMSRGWFAVPFWIAAVPGEGCATSGQVFPASGGRLGPREE